MTIWRMRIACWITKAANTHSEYVILIDFAWQQWLQERASMLRYKCTACLLNTLKLRTRMSQQEPCHGAGGQSPASNSGFIIPYICDYITNKCSHQTNILQNHGNEPVHNIGEGETQQRKYYKGLQLVSGDANFRPSTEVSVTEKSKYDI